jgi:hypothetical protein
MPSRLVARRMSFGEAVLDLRSRACNESNLLRGLDVTDKGVDVMAAFAYSLARRGSI